MTINSNHIIDLMGKECSSKMEGQVTVLFGAGATTAFVPSISSKTILEAIRYEQYWKRVIAKVPPKLGASGNRIKKIKKSILARTQKEKNFENVIEIIDRISSYKTHSSEETLFDKSVNILFGNKKCHRHRSLRDYKEYAILPFLVREIIANKIIDDLTEHEDYYRDLVNQQNGLLDYLSTAFCKCKLVSLNYDTLVKLSLNSVFDERNKNLGFSDVSSPPDSPLESILDVKRSVSQDRTIIYPHGSILFNRIQGYQMVFYKTADTAEEMRWEGLKDSFTRIGARNDFSTDYNSFIVSGKLKSVSISGEPYSNYYQMMIDDIHNSNVIICIGYSFQDSHINSALLYYLQKSTGNKLFIIDYVPDATSCKSVMDSLRRNAFPYMIFEFSDTDGKATYYSSVENQIFKNRLGWISSQIYYYGLGYNDFLRDYKTILASKPQEAS